METRMRRARGRGFARENRVGWLFASPYLVYALVFFLGPLAWAFWLTLTDWNLMSESWRFVGLSNFADALRSEHVGAAFVNSLKFLAAVVPITLAAAMAIAFVLHALPPSLKGIFSVIFFVPYLSSGVATSVFVKFFFSYSSSLNTWLREARGIRISWFTDPTAAFWVIVGIIAWKVSGYYALFLFASLESVPPEIGEAAEIDGASAPRRFFSISLPAIMPTVTTVVVLGAGLAYGIFSEPFLLTGGGPRLATTTWQLELYNASFVSFRSGYGAAIAMLMAANIFIVIRSITAAMDKFADR
jgi:multiple sugar transport system permease protein